MYMEFILEKREKLATQLWQTYNSILNSLKSKEWKSLLEEYFKPDMIPIQRVIRAPKIKCSKYNSPNQIHYVVLDLSGSKVEKEYILTTETTLY